MTPLFLMKCEQCEKNTHVCYITVEGKIICDDCHEKLHGKDKKKEEK